MVNCVGSDIKQYIQYYTYIFAQGTKTMTLDIKHLTDSQADMMAWALGVGKVPSNLVSDIDVNDCIVIPS